MMHAPFREDRKRRFSDMEEVYCGPEEFMEAGVRGFLVTTQADKEEFGIDDSIELLRQASIMVYGGYTTRRKKNLDTKGYVRINFMDPGDVQILQRPEGEPESEDEEEEEAKKEKTEEDAENAGEGEGEGEDKEDAGENKEDGDGDETKEDTEEGQEKADDTEGTQDKSKKEEDDKSKKGKKKTPKQKTTEEGTPEVYMRCQHKFKAYRTELRNTLFVKSNFPDPLELASTAMDLILKRRTVKGEALVQLLPVHGVCNYDFQQIEIMTQRVLRPYLDESLPPKSYSVMLFDKISEPGSEHIAETVRNAILCMNPNCWMTSPLTEPDVLVRVELIGSKVVLGAMTSFMMYRQYSPLLLATLGPGCPEDDDGTDMNEEMKREHEEALLRKKQAEERRLREEEERKRLAAEKRAENEERRIKKLEEKKKREEERLKREEENRKKREERKKKDEERRKQREEEKKAEAEKSKAENSSKTEGEGETTETEGGNEATEEADSSQNLDSSQSQPMDESGAALDESAVEAEGEAASDSEPKAKRGRRGRGRGKAKK